MKQRRVIFSRAADRDLAAIYRYIARESYPATAREYARRIQEFCEELDLFERGHRRDDLNKGVSILGFEKRVNIVVRYRESSIIIVRIFYGGQDWQARL